MAFVQRVDDAVENSFIGKFFEFKEKNATFSAEVKGATTSFLATAYILAVNPRILADSGGPCDASLGLFSPEYEECLFDIRKQYVTATALVSMVACLLMGIFANLPVILSCGMGMNAYFTYSVVGWRGTGGVSYQAAVTAVMIEGLIFFVLSVTGARTFLVKFVPEPVRIATPAGIGLFLAHLGLQTAEGIGMVVADVATSVTLGGCPQNKRTYMVAFDSSCQSDTMTCVTSDSYTCDNEGGIMTSATTWLGLVGLFITVGLLSYKKKSAFLVGIGFVTIISWFRNSAVTYFPDDESGNARFDYFSKVVSVEPLNLITGQFTSDIGQVAVALFTFLYIDLLDTTGTLFALTSMMGVTDKNGDFPKSRAAFSVDAIATSFGSIFGLSPVTSYIESAAGVEAGSRTGLTAVICGFYFFLSLFFAPIIANIPPWATGGCLIMVGALMCNNLSQIKWEDPAHALTAFLVVILMPLTYSIANGLIYSILFWYALQLTFKLLDLVGIKREQSNTPGEKAVGDETPSNENAESSA